MVGEQVGPFSVSGDWPSGPFGPAWRAIDARTNEVVILRALGRAPADRSGAVPDRLQQAAGVLSSVTGPGILPLREVVARDADGFAAYQATDIPTLYDAIRTGRQLPPASVANVLRHLAWALSTIHARGAFHSCLCPHNVFLSPLGEVKLSDLGLALLVALWTGNRPAIAPECRPYFAPELLGPGTIDARTDIYALGVLLYEAMANRPPMTLGEALREFAQRGDRSLEQRVRAERAQGLQHLDEAFAEPRLLNPRASTAISNATMMCLNAAPETRPQSIAEIAEYLTQFGIYLPDSPAAPTAPEPAAPRKGLFLCPECTRPTPPTARACLACGRIFPERFAGSDTPRSYFHEAADDFFAKGRLDEAARTYERALFAEPDNAVLAAAYGDVLTLLGRYPNAEEAYRSALRVRPDDPELHADLAHVLLAHGKAEDAQREYEAAERLGIQDENAVSAKIELGSIAAQRGDIDGAILRWMQALQVEPNIAPLRFYLGCAFAARYDEREAITQWEEACRIDPTDLEAARLLAEARLRGIRRPGEIDRSYGLVVDGPPTRGLAGLAILFGSAGIAGWLLADALTSRIVQPQSGASAIQPSLMWSRRGKKRR
jgi:tetratricopeptide (TPR) repeat protein